MEIWYKKKINNKFENISLPNKSNSTNNDGSVTNNGNIIYIFKPSTNNIIVFNNSIFGVIKLGNNRIIGFNILVCYILILSLCHLFECSKNVFNF